MANKVTIEKIKKLKPGDKILFSWPKVSTPIKAKFIGFYNPKKPDETKLNKSKTFSFAEVEIETGEIKKIFSLSQIVEIIS